MKDLWSNVEKTDGCWLWRGATNNRGYGVVRWNGSARLAHRVAWLVANGAEPDGLVCHRCDTPLCVRPDHLFVGTQTDNMRDAAAKGRAGGWSRERRERTGKISVLDAYLIGLALKLLPVTHVAVAKAWGVSTTPVRRIAAGKHWALEGAGSLTG